MSDVQEFEIDRRRPECCRASVQQPVYRSTVEPVTFSAFCCDRVCVASGKNMIMRGTNDNSTKLLSSRGS